MRYRITLIVVCLAFGAAFLVLLTYFHRERQVIPASHETGEVRPPLVAAKQREAQTTPAAREIPGKPGAGAGQDSASEDSEKPDLFLVSTDSKAARQKALLVYDFLKRNSLLKHTKEEFTAHLKGKTNRFFEAEGAGVTLKYLDMAVSVRCVGKSYFISGYEHDMLVDLPKKPLPSPQETLFADQGDGFIRYTIPAGREMNYTRKIDDKAQIAQVETLAGLTFEEGERIARQFVEKNFGDMTGIFTLSRNKLHGATGVSVKGFKWFVVYSYTWRQKPLEGEIYRYDSPIYVEVNPKTRKVIQYVVPTPVIYDIAFREPPPIDSDSAFRMASDKLEGDERDIVAQIEKNFRVEGEVRTSAPVLFLYAVDRTTGRLYWFVEFKYMTEHRKHKIGDYLTTEVMVDAETGEACYEKVGNFGLSLELDSYGDFPIKVEPCPYYFLAADAALWPIRKKLPKPTLPKKEQPAEQENDK
jgi:hypothetical protein